MLQKEIPGIFLVLDSRIYTKCLLKSVQPAIPSGIVPKPGNKREFVCAVAILHDAVQPDIKRIPEDELVNA